MPAYTLTYRNENVTEQTEWITPVGWSEQRIREDFEDRYRATVLTVQQLPE